MASLCLSLALKMESLFNEEYVNTQPLRKYEPLIRYDIDGHPQPKKLLKDVLNGTAAVKVTAQHVRSEVSLVDKELKKVEKPKILEAKPVDNGSPKKVVCATTNGADLKRKVNEPSKGPAPKKKQMTMLSFFSKKE